MAKESEEDVPQEEPQGQSPRGRVLVTLMPNGEVGVTHEGTTVYEVPTLCRMAAALVERKLLGQ